MITKNSSPRPKISATYRHLDAKKYLAPGGPWAIPTLDQLFRVGGANSSGSLITDLESGLNLDARALEAMVATLAGGLRTAALGNPVDPEVNSATAISDPRAGESVTTSLPAISFSKRELGPRMSSGFKKILGERTFSACSTWADPAWWWIGNPLTRGKSLCFIERVGG